MEQSHEFILTIGGLLLLGIATDALGKHTHLPRVTLLLFFGLLIGVNGLDIIPKVFIENYGIIADIALIMIGFLVGGKLTNKVLRKRGSEIITIASVVVILTAAIVALALYILGLPIELAVLFGCISSATAPAATLDVVMESNKKGPFVDRLVAIVALDDLLGLLVFSVCLAIFSVGQGDAILTNHPLFVATKEILGAVLLGIGIGIPAAFLTGKTRPGRPLVIEAVGLILVCGGLAMWFEVSHLIAAIVMGSIVANFAKHHEYSFHEIENIEWPFMVLFFTLAGASIGFVSINEVLIILIVYILFRVVGKLIGAYIGCKIAAVDAKTTHWMGSALLPQAGVAIGMALVASNYFPAHQNVLLAVIIGATVLFELSGPIITRIAIEQASEDRV